MVNIFIEETLRQQLDKRSKYIHLYLLPNNLPVDNTNYICGGFLVDQIKDSKFFLYTFWPSNISFPIKQDKNDPEITFQTIIYQLLTQFAKQNDFFVENKLATDYILDIIARPDLVYSIPKTKQPKIGFDLWGFGSANTISQWNNITNKQGEIQ